MTLQERLQATNRILREIIKTGSCVNPQHDDAMREAVRENEDVLNRRHPVRIKDIKFGPCSIRKVQIVRGRGTDIVMFDTAPGTRSTFPEMSAQEPGSYAPCFRVEARRGYSEAWLKAVFGIDADDPDLEIVGG